MSKPITSVRLLVNMLSQLKYMFIVILTRLGLSKPQEEDFYSGELNNTTTATATANNNNYVLMLDWSSLVPVPVPVPLVTSFIKKQIPVIQFGNFLERRREDGKDEDVEKEVSCAVCWDCINRRHEVRDLCNCSHVFHRDCLDRWVDEGRVTCPLCRSMLLPPNTNPWMVLRHAPHLSQQDQIPPIT
ncbi:hypothetical protein ACSBR2_023169 [Camellia fascicularis]